MKSARSNCLSHATSVVWLILIIAYYPLVAQATPMQGDRFTVSFSGLSFSNAEFTLGNQLPDGSFVIEDFTIRMPEGPRWVPSDMLQGFYNSQVNRLVECFDAGCTQYSLTASRSAFGDDIQFGTVNGWNLSSPVTLVARGAYNVNPVPTAGTYTVALNASSCLLPSGSCSPFLVSGGATFGLGSQLSDGNYEVQELAVQLGLWFLPSDMLYGFYNPEVNRLVECLDASCTQWSGTQSRSPFGDIVFGNSNEWNVRTAFGEVSGQYSISPLGAIPEPQTISLMVSGILAMFIATRRRVFSRRYKR